MDVKTIAEAELRLGNAMLALKEGNRFLVLEIRKHGNSLNPDWVRRTHDSLQEIREMICDGLESLGELLDMRACGEVNDDEYIAALERGRVLLAEFGADMQHLSEPV